MTDDRTLERAARSWLEEGPVRAPDRAVDVALSRIQTTRQERELRLPWRFPTMNPMTRIAAMAAALAVAVGAVYVFFRPASNVGPQGSQLPTAVATAPVTIAPSPTAAPRVTAADVGRTLTPGEYRTDGFPIDVTFSVSVGWKVGEFTASSFGLARADDASVNVAFLRLDMVYPDPCHTGAGPQPLESGGGALFDALAAMPGFSIDNATDTTLGGAPARTFLFGNDIDVAAAGCSGDMLPFGTRADGLGGHTDVAMFGGEYDQFWILHFGERGTLLVAVTDNRVPIVQSVLDSLKFDVPATGLGSQPSAGSVAPESTGNPPPIPTGTYEQVVPVTTVQATVASGLFTDQDRRVITDTLRLADARTLTVRLVITSGAITIQHAADGGVYFDDGTWPTPEMENGTLGIKYNPAVLGHVFSYQVEWNADQSAFRLQGGGSSPELSPVARALFALLVTGDFAPVR